MSVLINMGMPEKQTTLTIFPNGYVAIYDAKDSFIGETKAFPVPPHGRLVDESDAITALLCDNDYAATLTIRNLPTIIPAEPPKEESYG